MAKTISDEEIQLRKKARRRLVGAIALVILAAVLLPMVLDKEPKPVRQDISIEIPKPDSTGFTSIVVPATEHKPDSTGTMENNVTKPADPKSSLTMSEKLEIKPEPAEIKSTPKTESKPVENKEKVVTHSAKPANENTAEVTPKVETSSIPGSGFVVQLGAFSSAVNAQHLQKKLTESGIKSYTDMLKTPKGEKTRVRAGPFPTREAAEKAQAKLKTLGLNGIVAEKQ